jgi:hypothetical protein
MGKMITFSEMESLTTTRFENGYDLGVSDVTELLHRGYDLEFIEALTPGERRELLDIRENDMKTKKVFLFPTLHQATDSWNRFCKRYEGLITQAKRNPLSVTLKNGDVWYFRSDSLGQRGLHADLICIDEFYKTDPDKILDEKVGEAFVKRG